MMNYQWSKAHIVYCSLYLIIRQRLFESTKKLKRNTHPKSLIHIEVRAVRKGWHGLTFEKLIWVRYNNSKITEINLNGGVL